MQAQPDNKYGHLSAEEEVKVRSKHIMFGDDQQCLEQFNFRQQVEQEVNPIGDAKQPFCQLPFGEDGEGEDEFAEAMDEF
mmetsp:Transcript_16618/g.25616  ORF Transcript_16618/g.25616 Transcript_16618/m.25616 type:complete len:80 (-) Transcript_16618:59-298(-)